MPIDTLSRRERQIMDAIHQNGGRATASEIQQSIADAPGYSAVRALLRILEDKGHLRHEQDGARYVYLPAVSPEKAKRSALRHLLDTFFNGNAESAVATLLDDRSTKLDDEALERISKLIRGAKKRKQP